MRRRILMAGAFTVTIGLAAVDLAATPVGAAPARHRAEASEVVNAVAGSPAPAKIGPGASSLDGQHRRVRVSTDPGDGLAIEASDGAAVSVGIPAGRVDGVIEAGNVVYPRSAGGAQVVARPTPEGAQALIVVDGAAAPTRFEFPIDVDGTGARLVHGPGGTVQVYRRHSTTSSATVLPAWATDALGRPVPTRYEIAGSTLVQVVDHTNAAYPVVADPNTCGWVTCTYYFGRRATKDIANLPAVAGPVCALMVVVNSTLAAGCAVYAGAIVYQAMRARDRRRHCLKIKYPRLIASAVPVLVPQIYSGKRCK